MELDDAFLSPDENCVFQYVNAWPGDFIAEKQIARCADGKDRFMTEPRWTRNALNRLLTMGLIETDGAGRYRRKIPRIETSGGKKFISPQLREILEKSGRHLDLSSYAS